MSGDYSRKGFDPKKNYARVKMQQGRVQLDSDWNEFAALLDRHSRAETIDIIGRSAVPRETPQGFRIEVTSGGLTIGPGRIYVDGLLAENHGKAPLEFDAVLGELRGVSAVPYNEQPYFPNIDVVAPPPATGATYLVYVVVWLRHVTSLQDPDLTDKAVGIDTTTRLQTVWQVKTLAVGPGTTCGSPLAAWDELIAPSAGRLSSAAVGVPTNTDPCLLPPSGGYRGLENRLYRVEIHDGGPSGTATFKWSSDNACREASVTAITALDKLTVASLGRDSEMNFKTGDWVEITDDWREFAGLPGVMAQIKSIDESNRIISLVSPIPAGVFATDPQGNTDPPRHTRVLEWNQKGKTFDTNGNLLVDLNAPGSKGVIPVPASDTSIDLENGVQITFDTPASGSYNTGDFWIAAARTADASVEVLEQEPPQGQHRHFAKLAVVTPPSSVTDCRTLWPPEVVAGRGEGCECTVCVSSESHNQGKLTIQLAIDRVKAAGGGAICLDVGTYNLGEVGIPIDINGAHSLTLRGKGEQTKLIYTGRGPALVVDSSSGVTIEKLMLVTSASGGDTRPAILFTNSSNITLQNCTGMRLGGAAASSAVVGLAGILVGTVIRENAFLGPVGIGNTAGKPTPGTALTTQTAPLLSQSLEIQDNAFSCSRNGIRFTDVCVHTVDTRFSNNSINNCSEGGIVALGAVPKGSSVAVDDNELSSNGPGIVVGTGSTRVSGNSISGVNQKGSGAGIVLASGLDKSGLEQCHVIGNRITGIGGIGISIEAVLKSAMIKNNFIDGAVFGGIVMGEKSSAGFITVENNEISGIVPRANNDQASVLGIRLVNAKRADVTGNAISGVGLKATDNRCVGVQLLVSGSVAVAGNRIIDIGPAQGNAQTSAGIEAIGAFDQLDVVGNNVRRNTSVGTVDNAEWLAVLIFGEKVSPPGLKDINTFFAAKTKTSFLLFSDHIVAQREGTETLSLCGNFLEAYGIGAAVRAVLSGSCTFTDNNVFCVGDSQAAVVIAANAAILNANHVQGTEGEKTIVIKLPDGRLLTALGNITTHSIEINGAVLGAPWAPLNVQAL